MDSDDARSMNWGDGGRLYVFIRERHAQPGPRGFKPMRVQKDVNTGLDAGDEHSPLREEKRVVQRHIQAPHCNFFPASPPQGH
ncbi:hypothetical protein [Phenylobacterium sp. LjRoot225]|uniref:hypothetical protein n=1 Tax=Phenylobacterium sp. LjRoot225 TaxID=3342285 RepID=UPI003F5066E4